MYKLFVFLNETQKRMLNYVIEYVQEAGNVDYNTAKRLVNDSVFKSMLKDKPEFVSHYGIEYWGDLVIKNSM